MRTTRLLIGTVACAAAIAGLTGCGGDKKADAASAAPAATSASPSPSTPKTSGVEALSAKEISDKAEAALKSAPSLTMDLMSTSGSEQVKGKVSLDRKGNCSGNLGMGKEGSFEILQSGGKVWVKPDSVFLKTMAGAEAAKLMAGKYLKGASAEQMATFCDLKQFTKDITADRTHQLAKLGVQTVDGVRTVAVSGNEDGGKTTIYVAIEGTPYPVKLVHTGKESGTVVFSDFGKPVVVAVPPAGQVIDPSKL